MLLALFFFEAEGATVIVVKKRYYKKILFVSLIVELYIHDTTRTVDGQF